MRLYADGIPATMPDGQGQVSHVPLGALADIVVLRGPFSALYGNASGGVIQFFSAGPAATPEASLDIAVAADDLQRSASAHPGPGAAMRQAAIASMPNAWTAVVSANTAAHAGTSPKCG